MKKLPACSVEEFLQQGGKVVRLPPGHAKGTALETVAESREKRNANKRNRRNNKVSRKLQKQLKKKGRVYRHNQVLGWLPVK